MDRFEELLRSVKDEVEGKEPSPASQAEAHVARSPAPACPVPGTGRGGREEALLESVRREVERAPGTAAPPASNTSEPPSPRATSFEVSAASDSLSPLLSSVRNELEAREAEARREAARREEEERRQRALAEKARREAEEREARRLLEAQALAERQRREAVEAERRRHEEQKRKEQQALLAQAQRWLAALQPRSPESKWFDKFAENYPSRLEAAVAYLQALDEADP